MPDYNSNFTPEELQTEIWKPIPGYEGFYEASSIGRIRGVQWSPRLAAGIPIKPRINKQYLVVCLSKEKVRKWIYVHQLIALAFLGPRPEGRQVNHKDGAKLNNRLSNLEYLTHKQNMEHAARSGLMATLRNGRFKHRVGE